VGATASVLIITGTEAGQTATSKAVAAPAALQ
jgi:hypothetical protein